MYFLYIIMVYTRTTETFSDGLSKRRTGKNITGVAIQEHKNKYIYIKKGGRVTNNKLNQCATNKSNTMCFD